MAPEQQADQGAGRPLVTVLITAFNTPPEYLRQAVLSALEQDLPNLEVLVLDDGSRPSLAGLLADIGDPRLVYRVQEHRGPARALRAGLEMARGRYLAVLDHDDRLTPGSLSLRLAEITERGCGLVYGDLEIISPSGEVLGRQVFPAIDSAAALVRAGLLRPLGPLKHSTVLMDRRVALQTGNYDAGLACEYDLDLILKIALAAGFSRLDRPVAQYRVHGGNLSASTAFRLRQISCRWRLINRYIDGSGKRLAARISVTFILLLKAAWQLFGNRPPAFLLSRPDCPENKKNI